MKRATLLIASLLLSAGLWSEDSAAQSHTFISGEVRRYLYKTIHEVKWESAGDKLTFNSEFTWDLSCYADSVSDTEAVVVWRVLGIKAKHTGPEGSYAVNSQDENTADDALLGDMFALIGVPLRMRLDLASGQVHSVEGFEAIIAAINTRHPAPNPTMKAPRDAEARAIYNSDALAALWTRILTTPKSGTERSPIGFGVSGDVIREWDANNYQLSLPEAQVDNEKPRVSLGSTATPLDLEIVQLSGNGTVAMKAGVLHLARADITYELAVDALTQGVRQQHRLAWEIAIASRSTSPQPEATDDLNLVPVP